MYILHNCMYVLIYNPPPPNATAVSFLGSKSHFPHQKFPGFSTVESRSDKEFIRPLRILTFQGVYKSYPCSTSYMPRHQPASSEIMIGISIGSITTMALVISNHFVIREDLTKIIPLKPRSLYSKIAVWWCTLICRNNSPWSSALRKND